MRTITRDIPAVAALLLSFGAAVWLKQAAGLNDGIVILTVALTVALSQQRLRLYGPAVLPVVAIAANEVAWLFDHHATVADGLFTLWLSAAIWVRRFGDLATQAGTLATLPFVAILVSPVPPGEGAARPLWAALAALISFFAVATARFAARIAGAEPSAAPPPAAPAAFRGRFRPSTRMACQMALALGAAFLVGRVAYPDHWTWTVLTAFIVCSGNRGRGDVVHMSALRVAGAAGGTVVATLLAGAFGPGETASVALILAVLAAASWLRRFSYAYWAAAATAVLALLYGYYGQTGTALLLQRLGEIAIGAVLGIAASWFVLPIRSTDVVRRRAADALLVLRDVLAAARSDPDRLTELSTRFGHSLQRLDQVAPPLVAHRRLVRHRRTQAPHPADALDALRDCAVPVRMLAELAASGEGRDGEELVRLTSDLSARAVAARTVLRAGGAPENPGKRGTPAAGTGGPA